MEGTIERLDLGTLKHLLDGVFFRVFVVLTKIGELFLMGAKK